MMDPMRKREEFAVSLRKEKKEKIIRERRKRLMLTTVPSQKVNDAGDDDSGFSDLKLYECCPLFVEESQAEEGKQ